MRTVRVVLGVGAVVGAGWIAACSTGAPHGELSSALQTGELSLAHDVSGSVGMHLNIPNSSYTISSLNWNVSNGTNSYNGTVNMTDDAGNAAQSIEFVVGGVSAGSGYVVTLSGSDSNGDPCSGSSAPVAVSAGMTSNAMVQVICVVPADAALPVAVDSGTVAIDAGITLVNQLPFACPGIAGVSISPAELLPPGETSTLTSVSTTGAGGTDTFLWTATCGNGAPVITNPTQPNATFSCGTAFSTTCTVTLTVGMVGTGADGGSVGPVCSGIANTSISETIACEPQCVTSADCKTSTACVVPTCTAGRCVPSDTFYGTACSDSGGQICNGAGTCVVPSFDVVRLGNGSAVTAGTTVPVFIDQYSLTGALLASTPLPTAVSGSNQPLTLVGSDVGEGDLTTSVDGRFVVMGGHNYVPGSTIGAAMTGVAFISGGPTPTINTSVQLPLALAAGGVVRSAVSLDGTQAWVMGAATTTTGGLWYTPGDVQVVQTNTTKTGRCARIFGNQLYADSNANPPGLFAVNAPVDAGGSGLPITGTPAPVLKELTGLPVSGGSPYGFVFLMVGGVETLYIADDQGSGVGGIVKFTLSGTTWTNAGHVTGVLEDAGAADGGTGMVGYRGLAGYVTGTTVTLMASSGMTLGGQDELVVIVDNGGTVTQTPVAVSATNETFRGVAIPPHP